MRPAPVRFLLMILLVLAVGILYWRHFDNRMADIMADAALRDDTAAWNDGERRELAKRADFFQKQWGIRVAAHVGQDALELPRLSPTTLFLGADPARGQAVLVVPGLAAQALKAESLRLGRDVRLELEQNLGLCVQGSPDHARCFIETLDALRDLFSVT